MGKAGKAMVYIFGGDMILEHFNNDTPFELLPDSDLKLITDVYSPIF
jgi:hypothetical protein